MKNRALTDPKEPANNVLHNDSMDELVALLRQAEISLHQPNTRCDASKVQSLLHESFLEFGRSGTTYDRGAILNLLASEKPNGRVLSQDFAVMSLGTNAALLTYRSAIVDNSEEIHRHTLRASIWIHTSDGWKLQFHQGTPTESFKIADQ